MSKLRDLYCSVFELDQKVDIDVLVLILTHRLRRRSAVNSTDPDRVKWWRSDKPETTQPPFHHLRGNTISHQHKHLRNLRSLPFS